MKISEQSFADGSRKGAGNQWAFWVCSPSFQFWCLFERLFFLLGNVCSHVYVGVWNWMLLKCCRLCWMQTGERLYSQSHGPAVMLRARWWIGWLLSLPGFRFFSLPLSLFLTVPICPSLLLFLSSLLLITEVEALYRMETVSFSHTQTSWICRWSLPEHILVHEEKPTPSFHRLSWGGTLEGEDKSGWSSF